MNDPRRGIAELSFCTEMGSAAHSKPRGKLMAELKPASEVQNLEDSGG